MTFDRLKFALPLLLALGGCAATASDVADLTTTCVVINIDLDEVRTDGCDYLFDTPYVRHRTIGLPPRAICLANGKTCKDANLLGPTAQ